MRALVKMAGVEKCYFGGPEPLRVLADTNLAITENEYVGIVGSSGSGKSTLLGLIGCLDTPTSGEYLLGGRDVSRLSAAALAHVRNTEVGFVFQSFCLLPRMTALENVMRPLVYRGLERREREDRARRTLARVGLSDRVGHLPGELSGGQCQRVAIARALVTEPSIVLADEPTGNLDTEASRQVMELLDAVHDAGRTVIVVTHEAAAIARCKRVIRLVDGGVVLDHAVEPKL